LKNFPESDKLGINGETMSEKEDDEKLSELESLIVMTFYMERCKK